MSLISLRYTVIVLGPAYGAQNASLAYQCCQALLARQHLIQSIFFYAEGVHNANRYVDPASDEFHLVNAWQSLHDQHHIPLQLCYSAARRRGVIDDLSAHGFTSAGLTALSESIAHSDRVLQF